MTTFPYSLPYSLTDDGIFVIVSNTPRNVSKTNPLFEDIKAAAMAADEDALVKLLDIKATVAHLTNGQVTVRGNSVFYEETKLPIVLATKILHFHSKGESVDSLCRFAEKLMKNPNESVKEDLFTWLEKGKMPIYDDGDFAAFKKVKSDFKSIHDGITVHVIGKEMSMNREDCDENRDVTCSTGLHFCSYEYLRTYRGDHGKVLILKINPKDVVAIPVDYNNSKGRACQYTPIGEVDASEVKWAFAEDDVISSFGTYNPQPPVEGWDTDDSWEEEPVVRIFMTKDGMVHSPDTIVYEVDVKGVGKASDRLGIPPTTLRRWYKEAKEMTADNVVGIVNGSNYVVGIRKPRK